VQKLSFIKNDGQQRTQHPGLAPRCVTLITVLILPCLCALFVCGCA
jgi:hypothetical protein